ncbi:hypothetical protein H0H92_007957, partial [Tricholoma furcatifolium]
MHGWTAGTPRNDEGATAGWITGQTPEGESQTDAPQMHPTLTPDAPHAPTTLTTPSLLPHAPQHLPPHQQPPPYPQLTHDAPATPDDASRTRNPAKSPQGSATSLPPPSTCHHTNSCRRTPTRPTPPQPPPTMHRAPTTPPSGVEGGRSVWRAGRARGRRGACGGRAGHVEGGRGAWRAGGMRGGPAG